MKKIRERIYTETIAISKPDKAYIKGLHPKPEYKGYGDAGILSDIIGKHKSRQDKLNV